MELRAWLFGTLTVFDPQGRPLDLGSPTTRALLAYLLLHHREAVDRRRLAFVLWPRATESAVDCHFRATTIFEELGMIEELRQAQGQAAYERSGAVVIPGLPLRGPNAPAAEEA